MANANIEYLHSSLDWDNDIKSPDTIIMPQHFFKKLCILFYSVYLNNNNHEGEPFVTL